MVQQFLPHALQLHWQQQLRYAGKRSQRQRTHQPGPPPAKSTCACPSPTAGSAQKHGRIKWQANARSFRPADYRAGRTLHRTAHGAEVAINHGSSGEGPAAAHHRQVAGHCAANFQQAAHSQQIAINYRARLEHHHAAKHK